MKKEEGPSGSGNIGEGGGAYGEKAQEESKKGVGYSICFDHRDFRNTALCVAIKKAGHRPAFFILEAVEEFAEAFGSPFGASPLKIGQGFVLV